MTLDIGIDGFAIAKSSTHCGWPILGTLSNENVPPFLIAMYVGYKELKEIDPFLEDFAAEVKLLRYTGLQLVDGGPFLPFKIRVFTADTPARSKITGTRSFAHKAGCHKCDQRSVGDYNFFKPKAGNLRTDRTFRNRTDTDHHHLHTINRESELEKAGIGMVSQFPLDVMHLVDLGVAKATLTALMRRQFLGEHLVDVTTMSEKYSRVQGISAVGVCPLPQKFERLH